MSFSLSGLAASSYYQPVRFGQEEQAVAGRPEEADGKKPQAGLQDDEVREVEKLKARDREVRAHEQAHLAAAGGLAMSGATYTYQRGPDGVQYAIGGEVKIDTSPGSSPEETLRRAQIIRAAALAPAEPSGQDRSVAASAAKMEADARAELARQDSDDASQRGGHEKSGVGHPGHPYDPLAGFEPGAKVSVHA